MHVLGFEFELLGMSVLIFALTPRSPARWPACWARRPR
jgi:hypothetical protein